MWNLFQRRSRTESARARAIMGKNCLGPDKVRKHYGIQLPVGRFAEVPFSEKTLRRHKDTHVLFAGAPLSVSEILERADTSRSDIGWIRYEAFARQQEVDLRWYLLRKNPVPHSYCKTYGEQRALLAAGEDVPFACEVLYMTILYWMAHGEHLFPHVGVRVRDTLSTGERVKVGCLATAFHEFNMSAASDYLRNTYLGLAPGLTPMPI